MSILFLKFFILSCKFPIANWGIIRYNRQRILALMETMAFYPFYREPVAGVNRKKENCRSTSGATSDELEGTPFTAYIRRPGYMTGNLGGNAESSVPYGLGGGFFFFCLLKEWKGEKIYVRHEICKKQSRGCKGKY